MESFTKVGVDLWSMVLYLVNFGILFAVLGFLVIPKIKNLLDERRNSIAGDLEASAKLKEELTQTLTESEEQVKKLKLDMAVEKAELAEDFKKRREALISDMQAEREKVLDEARAQINAEKKQLLDSAKADLVAVVQHAVKAFLSQAETKEIEKSLADAWEVVGKKK